MSAAALYYRIQPHDPAAHLFAVRCTVPNPDPDGQILTLPAWTPGSYTIRDFARHVIAIAAGCRGEALAVTKLDKDSWRCAPCVGPLEVSFTIYAHDASVRAAYLDSGGGSFTGTSVFALPRGHEAAPCVLELLPPAGNGANRWEVATAMSPAAVDAHGFGSYRSTNYEELVDHPVVMGRFERLRFAACGVPHEVILSGRQRADAARLRSDLRRLCEHHIRFFGGDAPMQRYLFLVRVTGTGYGGLEHRASSSLLCARDDLPRPGADDVSEEYRSFLGLCSHEYFHTWNVKRIKPAAFTPYELSCEVYTRLLWVFEGVTSYYEDLALVRSGLITPASYLEVLGQSITRLLRNPGRRRQSIAESSFDAWTRFYKPDENSPNAIVSYYTKGALVALALDLTIRRDAGGGRSLDTVMRALWERYGKSGEGLAEDGFERLAEEISGLDLRAFFAATVRGTEDPPLAALLADFGVDYALRPAASQDDKGGKPVPVEVSAPRPRGALGARFGGTEEAPVLTHVFTDGAARAAGLAAGDVLVAVDGIRTTRSTLEKRIAAAPLGVPLRVHAFRGDELLERELVLRPAPLDTCYLSLRADVGETVRARRASWLGRRAPTSGHS